MRTTSTCLALLVVATSGCDRSSPTAPTQQPPRISVAFETPALDAHRGLITDLLLQAATTADGPLPVGVVRFTVGLDPYLVIPGWGIGGATRGPDQIRIVADPAHPSLAQVLVARLPSLAAHEIHHAVRWRGPGPPQTLLEALVMEGMADHFAIELLGGPEPPWVTALSEAQIALYMERARLELDSQSWDHQAWFFGLGATDLPRWTGYTLGYRLVGDYLASHAGATASSLVHAPAELFRPPAT